MMQNRRVLCKGTRVTRCNAADGTSSKPRTHQGPKKSKPQQSPEPEKPRTHNSLEVVFLENYVSKPSSVIYWTGPQSPQSPVCSILEPYLKTSVHRIPNNLNAFFALVPFLHQREAVFLKQPNCPSLYSSLLL